MRTHFEKTESVIEIFCAGKTKNTETKQSLTPLKPSIASEQTENEIKASYLRKSKNNLIHNNLSRMMSNLRKTYQAKTTVSVK